jgi:tripartite-type tricarboxylate transporter receptor subunit TctC
MEFAQKNPGKLTYGSAGNGSASHLATVLLAHIAKLDMVHVPYRGAGPALNDLLGGRTDFMITTLPSVIGLTDGSQMRPLAVTTKTRTKKYPDVPSIAESGWSEYEATAWYGFVVPKGTPKDVLAKLRDATVETITKGVVRERLDAEGAEPIGNAPEEFAAMMKAESSRWADVVKQANIKVD